MIPRRSADVTRCHHQIWIKEHPHSASIKIARGGIMFLLLCIRMTGQKKETGHTHVEYLMKKRLTLNSRLQGRSSRRWRHKCPRLLVGIITPPFAPYSSITSESAGIETA
ncbi:MAG: hypothetical protein C4520_18970 [Candidatus Abyssobacteria bacterium SURF_5]|uniref:Uncharacterized protein n=1 Tax=Abyssobacteria bacterium (strain SURF_5) TaxID=2093360 RepID=A0A3A4N8M8_ABYX5|nr:MAG: hypothetical protein C4520_18970 [Candidatus Abyssubacteria bacterium SURF_5]